MNQIRYLPALLAIFFILSGCKKESEDGGISISFNGNQPVNYLSLYSAVSQNQFGDPVKSASTNHVSDGVRIVSLKSGTYHWSAGVTYQSPTVSGTLNYQGEILIEKGKIFHITLED